MLDDAEILRVVAETRSLSQAANRLHMSRPGLSQRIASIERHYNYRFYERTPQGIFLTPAGELATDFARRICELEALFKSELATLAEHFEAAVRIGTSLADGVELLPQICRRYYDQHPDVSVHLDTGYEPEVTRKVKDGAVDFALLENVAVVDGVQLDILGYKELVLLAPNRRPYNLLPQPLQACSLLELPVILYEWETGRHLATDIHLRGQYGISLKDCNAVGQFDTHEAVVNGVRAGLGWAVVPECIAERYRHAPELLALRLSGKPMLYPVSFVRRAKTALRPEAEAFMQFIRQSIPPGYFHGPGA